MSMVWQSIGDKLFEIEKLENSTRNVGSPPVSPYDGSASAFEKYLGFDENKGKIVAEFLEKVIRMIKEGNDPLSEE